MVRWNVGDLFYLFVLCFQFFQKRGLFQSNSCNRWTTCKCIHAWSSLTGNKRQTPAEFEASINTSHYHIQKEGRSKGYGHLLCCKHVPETWRTTFKQCWCLYHLTKQLMFKLTDVSEFQNVHDCISNCCEFTLSLSRNCKDFCHVADHRTIMNGISICTRCNGGNPGTSTLRWFQICYLSKASKNTRIVM